MNTTLHKTNKNMQYFSATDLNQKAFVAPTYTKSSSWRSLNSFNLKASSNREPLSDLNTSSRRNLLEPTTKSAVAKKKVRSLTSAFGHKLDHEASRPLPQNGRVKVSQLLAKNKIMKNRISPMVLSYPCHEKDIFIALEHHEKGDPVAFELMMQRIKTKQNLHDGKRSHTFLSCLDREHFNYPKWQEDALKVEELLFNSVNAYAENSAMRLFASMKNKQRMYDGKGLHKGIKKMQSGCAFTYNGFKRDKIDAIREYRAGNNAIFQYMYECIEERQRKSDEIIRKAKQQRKVRFADEVPENSSRCVICLSDCRSYAFVPCGHLALCHTCASKKPYKKKQNSSKGMCCPVCRQRAESVMKIYM